MNGKGDTPDSITCECCGATTARTSYEDRCHPCQGMYHTNCRLSGADLANAEAFVRYLAAVENEFRAAVAMRRNPEWKRVIALHEDADDAFVAWIESA